MSAFDLARIRDELARAPLVEPWPLEVAIAVVNDVFRLGGEVHPPPRATWKAWATGAALLAGQAGMLAHLLASTVLREASVAALATRGREGDEPRPPAHVLLPRFFEAVAPLTAEMIRTNAFRQEEFVRRWVETVGGLVLGETPERSAQRLEQLDYRRTMKEYQRADGARKAEAARRAQLLKEAQEREAAERGWRE